MLFNGFNGGYNHGDCGCGDNNCMWIILLLILSNCGCGINLNGCVDICTLIFILLLLSICDGDKNYNK